MTLAYSLGLEVRRFPAYTRRMDLARMRGFPNDDPSLPRRLLEVCEDRITRWFIVGPVEPGGREERLIEVVFR